MSSKELLYVIGQPGAGKSSMMLSALHGLPYVMLDKPVPHLRYERGIQLGTMQNGFPSTDTLALNIQPAVLRWLRSDAPALIVGEGDRLANDAFFQGVEAAGYVLTVVYLHTPNDEAERRRRHRGSQQNAAWVKGRQTKVERLASTWADLEHWIDGRLPLDETARQLAALPAIRRLRGDNL
jgi:hypothetical protein